VTTVRRLVVHVCRDCGAQGGYAGTCPECYGRMDPIPVIPVQDIEAFRDEQVLSSSPVPALFIEHFVKKLFKRSLQPPSG
jgi:hypothetical protein